MTDADQFYNQFMYPNANAEYIVSIDGFLHLLKTTADDPNFQTYLKQKITYLLDRAEKCKKFITGQMADKQAAGFYSHND